MSARAGLLAVHILAATGLAVTSLAGVASLGCGGSSANSGGNGGAGGAGIERDAGSDGRLDAASGRASDAASDAGALPIDARPNLGPVLNQGLYTFMQAGVSLEIDPMTGGRITTFALNGSNILTGPSVNPLNWGSTFWPSPQSAWNWPPLIAIDSAPYSVVASAEDLLLQGGTDGLLHLSVAKDARMDAQGRVSLTYTLRNDGATTTKVAPWEITRVAAPGSLIFFPLGPAGIKSGNVPFVSTQGIAWYAFDAAQTPSSFKSFADGLGWLARVDTASGLIFVKTFPDIKDAQAAPGEGEVEIYVNDMKDYIELEAQGAYGDLAAGAAVDWTVGWMLLALPAGVERVVGNQALVDFVTAAIAARN